MAFVWSVECKTCSQRFAVKAREVGSGKSKDVNVSGKASGSFRCPHCHELHEYAVEDNVPGEGRLQGS